MQNGIPDSNMLDAACFHQRIQRLLREACESDDGYAVVDIGDVRLVMDRLGIKAFVGAGNSIAYSWTNEGPDRVNVTFRTKLVQKAREILDRELVLDALADI